MKRPLGLTLIYAGAAVCALGAVGVALGMFLTAPDALALRIVKTVAYSAPFLVGGAFMLCGALVVRAARREHAPDLAPRRGPGEGLPPGPAAEMHTAPREGAERRR